ncbi:MAG: shikimate dehydrogenase [Thermomicrobiales bacterium]
MKRAGVIGDPVDHSLSPIMHNAAFQELGIHVHYELWPTPADQLMTRVNSVRDENVLGANVTVPHKQSVFDLVDATTATADRVGAVNTIIPIGNGLLGDNTDVYGFTASLRESAAVPQRAVLLLGAGGASRAVLVALGELGVSRIYVANRTEQRARGLVDELGTVATQVLPVGDIPSMLGEIDLMINATSLGWHDDALPLPVDSFGQVEPGTVAMDLTYRDTAFLRAARGAGLRTIDGLGMLIHQGARSFALWTGVEPPVETMRAAVEAERARRGG